jgi:hypothetical protein
LHLAGKWQVGLDEKWRAIHMQRVIDGNRASWSERDALGTDRLPVMRCVPSVFRLPVIRQPDDSEKHEGPILA